jgi:hypothetical protein
MHTVSLKRKKKKKRYMCTAVQAVQHAKMNLKKKGTRAARLYSMQKKKKKEGYTPHGPKKKRIKKKEVGLMGYIFNLKKKSFVLFLRLRLFHYSFSLIFFYFLLILIFLRIPISCIFFLTLDS